MSPLDQERLKYKLVTDIAGALLPVGGATKIAKAEKPATTLGACRENNFDEVTRVSGVPDALSYIARQPKRICGSAGLCK